MPDTIANNGTAVPDMSRAAAKAIYPNGGRNRTAARVQAALLRGLVGLAAALTAAVLLFLIGYILVNGIPNLKPSLFAWEYNSDNVSLTPALINTVLMTGFALLIATPLGIFAAIWLVEYAHRGSKLVRLVRLTTETLQGIPSIVYGLFGMLFFVQQLHWGYSLIAGAFTLAIMVLPVIMRTTEEALIAVPDSYREGSFGLGAGKLRTVFTIVLPSAMPGILSGVILATGRIVGETAALIYTASSVPKIAGSVFSSARTLAVHMYLLSNEGLYINETYGGLSEKLATTYDAMVDNLADFQADMDAAMGEGYNEGRKEGLQAQMDWMSGESGAAVEEANRAIGAWQAELENSKEQYIRDAMDAMMASDEYQTAKAEGDAAEMGKLIMQAKVQGMNEYNASDGAQLALESEMSLVAAIRNDTGLNQDYWDAGYEKGQEFTKGLAAARKANYQSALSASDYTYTPTGEIPHSAVYTGSGYATGIDYVPYDNFPALLHQGERVQTAVEARSEGSSGGIQIVMYGTTIREDADVDRVAAALLQKMQLAGMRG